LPGVIFKQFKWHVARNEVTKYSKIMLDLSM
jgi:hypothetical protein